MLYPVLFLDALRVNIRDGATVVKKSVYVTRAIRLDGQKELALDRANRRGIEHLVRVPDGDYEQTEEPGGRGHSPFLAPVRKVIKRGLKRSFLNLS
jgi:hypothetical protein